jgi:hypothetical protein
MNKKILEYFTATDTNTKSLDKQVNAFIQQGYEPFEAPYIIPGEHFQVCQAIIRCENLGDMTLSAEAPL